MSPTPLSLASTALKTIPKALTAYSALSLVLRSLPSLTSSSSSAASSSSTHSSFNPTSTLLSSILHTASTTELNPLKSLTKRSEKNYEGHVPLNGLERGAMALGSGVVGVMDTRRGDLIALLTETTPTLPLPLLSTLPTLHSHLTSSPEGRQLLHDRPIMSSKTIDMEKLQGLKRGTVGREWVEWANEGGVTPDSREEVKHVDSPTLAYTLTRYRQTHDLYHTLFSLPPTLSHELTLKVIELSNMSLPVAFLSSLFGPFRLSASRRDRWLRDWFSYALRTGSQTKPLVGVYWEKRWEQGVGDLRRELGAKRMDDLGVEMRWKGYGKVRERERELRRKGEWVDEPEEW